MTYRHKAVEFKLNSLGFDVNFLERRNSIDKKK